MTVDNQNVSDTLPNIMTFQPTQTPEQWTQPQQAPQKKNHKLAYLVLGAIAIVVVIMAGVQSAHKTTDSTTLTDTASVPTAGPNAAFLADAKSADTFVVSDTLIIALGSGACADFAGGNSVIQTIQDGVNVANHSGGMITPRQAGSIIGAAVRNICPQYMGSIRTQLQTLGY